MAGSRDRGQVLPFYAAMMALMLFAALAFVVVGMAGARRSDAQGAADAAALGAAQQVRDNALTGWNLLTLTPEDWEAIIRGRRFDTEGACSRASDYAGTNEATVSECDVDMPEFTVSVRTSRTVGDSVIPGTEDMRANATATALIEPRCFLQPPSTPPPPEGGGAVDIKCRDGSVVIVNPSDPGSLYELARKLFVVRLTD
ncbi:pilus assembly protein TadG-related protein [Streptomyces sp. NPDC058401]|uniref:pilus assembly protein TadG-related protein n=1 Tax=Streptomyces sp. NPDC058401 TaxID=3346480 RepID=UPI0036533A6F